MSLKAILETLTSLTQRAPPKFCLSPGMVPLAYLMETWARFTKDQESMITVARVKLSRLSMYYSSQKVTEKLGYQAR